MLINRQREISLRLAPLRRFCERARRAVGVRADAVTLCLVSDRQIAAWNRTYRGKAGATDVLSFPAEANGNARTGRTAAAILAGRKRNAGVAGEYRGDIAISPAAARRNARRLGRTLDAELRVLVLHGLLHLAGYDHETDNGEMDRIELRLRRRLGIG